MSFTYFDHTGDIGVHLVAQTPAELFRDAAAAFTDTVTNPARIEVRRSVPVTLTSPALDLLLVDFLSEILYRFEVERFLVAAAQVNVEGHGSEGEPGGTAAFALHATLDGETFDADRHGVKVLVKAITYHALEVRQDPEGWHATVVFDL